MKVLHFILGKASKERANGVNQVVAGLAKYCVRQGAEVRVIGKARSVEAEGQTIGRDGFDVSAFSRWAAPLRGALRQSIAWSDVVHLHGVYSPWNILVARMCAKLERPYVVTLHDGLAPERARTRGRMRKWAFRHLLDRRYIERAAAVHVLALEEATDLFAVARPARVFCVSNGVDLDDYPAVAAPGVSPAAALVIGCLGRISPEKNLDALCTAFAAANRDKAMRLRIAGPMSEYGEQLQQRFGNSSVEFVGPKFGAEKRAFLRSLHVFVHASLSEVFSIAAMEALAVRVPLLITRSSKVSYFYDRKAFFMCEPTAYGLEQGLRDALAARDQWAARAENGRRLVEERLNWTVAARDVLAAYRRAIGDGL
jgi:glycosyltransferase involved in cell wall biosynthesis